MSEAKVADTRVYEELDSLLVRGDDLGVGFYFEVSTAGLGMFAICFDRLKFSNNGVVNVGVKRARNILPEQLPGFVPEKGPAAILLELTTVYPALSLAWQYEDGLTRTARKCLWVVRADGTTHMGGPEHWEEHDHGPVTPQSRRHHFALAIGDVSVSPLVPKPIGLGDQ